MSTQDDLQQNLTGFGLFNHRGRNEAGRTHSLEKARRVCFPLLWSSFFDGTCTNSIPLQGAVGFADQRRRPGTLPSRPRARSERPSLAYREKHHHHTSTRPSERPNSGSRASSFERALHTTAKPRLVHPVVRVLCGVCTSSAPDAAQLQVFHRFSEPSLFFQSQQDQSGFTSVSLLFLSVAPAALRMAGGFEALGLAPELVRAVTEDLGYLLPTNVQVSLIARQQSVDYAVVGACCWDTRYLRGASHAELDEIFCVRFSSKQDEPSYCCLLSC